jgi:DNA-binding CsgD family transcriptional regulator/PAS domain-containing protein
MRRNSKQNIPLETFSKIVEAIYDCALDPTRWQRTVRLIADLCRSQVCLVGVYDYTNGRGELSYNFGQAEEYIRLHEGKYKGMNPFWSAVMMQPIGVVTTQAMLIDDNEFWESRFYQEWCKPQRYLDMINFKIVQTEHRIGWWAAHRLEGQPRYGNGDIGLINLLVPHVCRAIRISDALNLKTIRSDALEAALNALTAGVYLVDVLGRVIYMNSAAEQQVGRGDVVRIEKDRLAPVDRMARTALVTAVDEAIADEVATPQGGSSLALPGTAGAGLVAAVLPLSRGERQNICGAYSAKAAVFVQDPVVVPPFPGEAFAKLYGLTGSELRVLLAMAPGLSVKEAAGVLGISETTAKTHLQHTYEKTRTSKQTELMHLFMSSTPPVKAAQEFA